MKEINTTGLRETLEQLPTPQLDALLRVELEKEPPDENAARMILKVLREREADYPVESNEQINRAYNEYEKKTESLKAVAWPKLLRAASVLVVICVLMFALPQEAKAMNFFERFITWTESVFSLISPAEAKEHEEEYVFKTDNPGLQEVYDKVTELGVNAPVVPMWLPEEYELVECKAENNPAKTFVTAIFSNGYVAAVFQIEIYTNSVSSEYFKDDTIVQEYEINGVSFSILKNNELCVAVWTIDNIECSLGIDCQEDVLNRILKSIYMTEEK